VNATPRNDELGTAADHDRPRTTFRAPGGRLARRHHHRPQRDRLLELSQRGENESPAVERSASDPPALLFQR
jgi:hypothetical protein